MLIEHDRVDFPCADSWRIPPVEEIHGYFHTYEEVVREEYRAAIPFHLASLVGQPERKHPILTAHFYRSEKDLMTFEVLQLMRQAMVRPATVAEIVDLAKLDAMPLDAFVLAPGTNFLTKDGTACIPTASVLPGGKREFCLNQIDLKGGWYHGEYLFLGISIPKLEDLVPPPSDHQH